MVSKSFKLSVWFLGLFFFITQSITPAYSFNIGEEREIGEKLLYSVRSSFKLIDDPDITTYITDLGRSVLEVAGVQYFDYHFFIIDSKEFNAFAAPSGLIFFYSGLIESMNSEDELVSVLAHEIGHIVKRHLAERIDKSKYSSITTLGLAVAAVAFGGAAAPALLTGALATGQSLNLHFSRENEQEADLLAYNWMKKLHRDTGGQKRMLQSMRRIARYRSDMLPQYLLTHPNPEARLDTIESLIEVDTTNYSPDYENIHDVEFLRFKYRILTQASSAVTLRASLASIASNDKSSELQKTMAKYGMAQLARTENNFSQARALLDEVTAVYPDHKNFLVDKGVVEFEAGKYREAEELLREAIGRDKLDMYATYTLGKLLQKTGREDEAIKLYKTVEYEMPEFAKVYFAMGQIYANQNKQGLAHFCLGKFNLYEGKPMMATDSFRAALRDSTLSDAEKEQIKKLLEKLKKMKK